MISARRAKRLDSTHVYKAGRVRSRFVETRYFQCEEQLASHARQSPKETCGAARYHPSQTISARISSTATLFAADSEKHGRLTGKMRIARTRETCGERGTRGKKREKTLCRGEIVKAAIEFILCGCVLISRDE